MLTYSDVVKLYPNTRGVKVSTLVYRSISFDSSVEHEKGLFIASNRDSDLLRAIGNGAVSTIWPGNIPIPAYTPNDFPVIYAEDSVEAMVKLVRKYSGKITLNKCGERAIIMFSNQNLQIDSIYAKIYGLLKENEVSKEMRNEGQ